MDSPTTLLDILEESELIESAIFEHVDPIFLKWTCRAMRKRYNHLVHTPKYVTSSQSVLEYCLDIIGHDFTLSACAMTGQEDMFDYVYIYECDKPSPRALAEYKYDPLEYAIRGKNIDIVDALYVIGLLTSEYQKHRDVDHTALALEDFDGVFQYYIAIADELDSDILNKHTTAAVDIALSTVNIGLLRKLATAGYAYTNESHIVMLRSEKQEWTKKTDTELIQIWKDIDSICYRMHHFDEEHMSILIEHKRYKLIEYLINEELQQDRMLSQPKELIRILSGSGDLCVLDYIFTSSFTYGMFGYARKLVSYLCRHSKYDHISRYIIEKIGDEKFNMLFMMSLRKKLTTY